MKASDVKVWWRRFRQVLHDYDQRRFTRKNLTKDEVIQLLKSQHIKYIGRSLGRDLQASLNMLDFGNQKIRDHMISIKKVLVVGSDEPVGPILVDELYQSGRKIFLVKDKNGELQGTVRLRDLAELVKGGKVAKVLDHEIFYVSETDSLFVILEQFSYTGKTIFAVKNEQDETTGAVYLEDIINQITNKT